MLRTLGALSLKGLDAPFRKKKPLLLLTYLVLEGPRSRRYLAELFWPGASDGLNSLSVALNQLRTAGVWIEGEEVLRAEVACDAIALQSALAGGEHLPGQVQGRLLWSAQTFPTLLAPGLAPAGGSRGGSGALQQPQITR